MENSQPPISVILEQLGVPHKVFRHERPVTSFEQAANDRGQRPSQIVRSILFRVTDGEYAMVLMAGQGQISWKKLRQVLGRSRISMASEEEVLDVTGYRVGAVGPFGLLKQARVIIDAGVLKEEEISIGSGVRSVAVILKSRDLQKALGDVDVLDLSEDDA